MDVPDKRLIKCMYMKIDVYQLFCSTSCLNTQLKPDFNNDNTVLDDTIKETGVQRQVHRTAVIEQQADCPSMMS